ncbi:hypothetical protein E2C06_22460 [Dankookia rubra]|uniref:Uncharacterized protein n=1 Tax=Dankookia rubra TaxID=1442381 RepID=A0A4R5QC04_9PROT|nr:hypothetical protein [Dankookia rubra]TDH60386.1 hypothetical protein E2C06_22460 [Dankookia rubra]
MSRPDDLSAGGRGGLNRPARDTGRHRVRCGDFADEGDPEEEWQVEGFASAEAAQEYARRFVRAQVEDLRREAASPAELAEMYDRWGEYAETPGFDLAAWVTHCIANPAARKQDTDYAALEP